MEWHEGREQEVPLETATHGDFEIDGVEGKGAKIELAYEKPGSVQHPILLQSSGTKNQTRELTQTNNQQRFQNRQTPANRKCT